MNINNSNYIFNEENEKLEVLGNIVINLEYWDCECYENYIHPIKQKYCNRCNAFEEDSPNSRENEVKLFGKQ
jgi:hypothetical protein